MAQSASVENIRNEALYWNAELALAISYHRLGKVTDEFLEHRFRAVSNIQNKKEPLSHLYAGKKSYSRE